MKKLKYAVMTVVWDWTNIGRSARHDRSEGIVALSFVTVAVALTAVAVWATVMSMPMQALALFTVLASANCAIAALIAASFVSPGVEARARRAWFAAADAAGVADRFRRLP